MTRTFRYILWVTLLAVAAEPAALAQETPAENPAAGDYIDHEGRYKLLATTTLFGAIEGALIPAALGVESERASSSLALAGASAGFFVPFMLTEDYPVTEARATFTLYGGSQGLAHGIFLAGLLGGNDLSPELGFGITALSTAAQLGIGYSLPGTYDLSAGTGEMLGFGSAYGMWTGILGSILLFGESNIDAPVRAISGLALAGSIGGNYAAWALSRAGSYTQGDARVFARTGLLGVQTAITAHVLMNELNTTSFSLIYLAGTASGLGAGYMLTRRRDFTRSEANIIFLGTIAGSLFTSGIGYGLEASPDAYIVLQLVGSLAGFAFTYSTYSDEATRRTGPQMGMRLSPTLLFAHDADGTNQSGKPVPGMNLSVTF